MEDGLAGEVQGFNYITILHLVSSNIPLGAAARNQHVWTVFQAFVTFPQNISPSWKSVPLQEIYTPKISTPARNLYRKMNIPPVVRILLSFDTNIAPYLCRSKYPYTVGSRLFHLQYKYTALPIFQSIYFHTLHHACVSLQDYYVSVIWCIVNWLVSLVSLIHSQIKKNFDLQELLNALRVL